MKIARLFGVENKSLAARYGSAIALSGLALALSAASGEFEIMLAAVAGVCVLCGKGPDLVALTVFLITIGYRHLGQQDLADAGDAGPYIRFVVLSASAVTIVILFRTGEKLKENSTAERIGAAIVDSMPGMGWSTDREGRYIYRNPSVLEYTAGSAEKAAPTDGKRDWKKAINFIHPDDTEHTRTAWLQSLATGTDFQVEHRVRRHDGIYRWFQVVARPARDDSGNVTGWYGTSIDIDDTKQVAEALRKSEQQLRSLVETMPVMVWCTTPDGEPSYINKRLTDYGGVQISHLDHSDHTRLSLAMSSVVHVDDLDDLRTALTHSFRTGEPFQKKYRHRHVNGFYRWVEGRAEPLRDGDGNIVQWYGVVNDIDDETRAQEDLRATQDRLARASQLTSLAELSASIAHEVNQPLAAIVANSNACQQWLSNDPPNLLRAGVSVEAIIRNANSAADVVSRMRALFKRDTTPRTVTALNDLVVEACQLMGDDARKRKVQISLELDPALPTVNVDRTQIQQVLINLIRNAIDAMQIVEDRLPVLNITTIGVGSIVQVTVTDTGSGLSNPDRIFEPFFTTKAQGMGMGLAICRSIIEAHEGTLSAANAEARGARMTFTIPVAETSEA